MDNTILERALVWTQSPYDRETIEEVKRLISEDEKSCIDAFYTDLEFGTGGLRGLLGSGTNRINKYTVAMTTQGFANYLTKQCAKESLNKYVAIAYDNRNLSKELALTTAKVFAANNFRVYIFDAMRPTPELSFAVRYFSCCAGVMITASHNPKEYNGYKAYGVDGGQLVAPHDTNVIDEVRKITSLSDIKMSGNEINIKYIGAEVDIEYIDKVCSLSLNQEAVRQQKDMKIVYTPLHGTGMTTLPFALKRWGFDNIICVGEQMIEDGNFSTVKSPNPEEVPTMEMAINLAKEVKADLILATDPDSDRVGVAIPYKNENTNEIDYILLNGNRTASVLIYYLINAWRDKGKLTGKEYIVKTIVTTELLKDIAENNGVKSYDVLTGFKYIAEVLEEKQGKEVFIGGGEESYGYLAGDFVRDKDAVISCCIIAEIAAYAANRGETFIDILISLYKEYGFYKESLVSITKKGISGLAEIKQRMEDFRTNPPKNIGGIKVIEVRDYEKGFKNLPKADVLQFFMENGSKVTIRPSGTEPKIKYYFSVKNKWDDGLSFTQQDLNADRDLLMLAVDFGL